MREEKSRTDLFYKICIRIRISDNSREYVGFCTNLAADLLFSKPAAICLTLRALLN